MVNSILDDVKKALGLDSAYTAFDPDVIMHINSVFTDLCDIGIGPATGFMIADNTTTWDAFIGTDLTLNSVKSYVYLCVKRLFDPPTTSFTIDSMNKLIDEALVRLSMRREATAWVDPNPPPTIPPYSEPPWWQIY